MSVQVFLPTGEQRKFPLSDNMTVLELKEAAARVTRKSPGFLCVRAENTWLTMEGKTLENAAPCRFLPSTVIHMALKVHGG